MRGERLLEFGLERVAILDAVPVAPKTRVGREIRAINAIAKLPELAVVGDAEKDLSVAMRDGGKA